jgi:hypothetical protein
MKMSELTEPGGGLGSDWTPEVWTIIEVLRELLRDAVPADGVAPPERANIVVAWSDDILHIKSACGLLYTYRLLGTYVKSYYAASPPR